MEIRTVGVVGAGVMGRGVSQALAQTGHSVILLDVSQDILEHAKDEIRENVRLQSLFGKRDATQTPDEVLGRILFCTAGQQLTDVDFVVENVTERWEIKKEVYAQLDAVCPERCVFAANTSAIPITRIASLTNREPQVIGLHFMNPVPLKPVVEMIRGDQTSDETVRLAKRLLAQMGKEAIIVGDGPGFVSNRVLMLAINEAIQVVYEGLAGAEDVDRIFKTCFAHKMGPLETADLIGLDTVLNSLRILHDSFGDSKYRPCPLLEEMVNAGKYGRKSGQGFYTYPMQDPRQTNREG